MLATPGRTAVGLTDFTTTLTWLVDTPSVIGQEAQICTLIATRLYPALGRDAVVRLGDSLIAGRRTGRPLLLLAGHLDTVPSQGQGPAFVEGDRLHGLGAADMKSGLAVMIHLLEDPAVDIATIAAEIKNPAVPQAGSRMDSSFFGSRTLTMKSIM